MKLLILITLSISLMGCATGGRFSKGFSQSFNKAMEKQKKQNETREIVNDELSFRGL